MRVNSVRLMLDVQLLLGNGCGLWDRRGDVRPEGEVTKACQQNVKTQACNFLIKAIIESRVESAFLHRLITQGQHSRRLKAAQRESRRCLLSISLRRRGLRP